MRAGLGRADRRAAAVASAESTCSNCAACPLRVPCSACFQALSTSSCAAGRRGDPPVVVAVPVQVRHLDRGTLEVEAAGRTPPAARARCSRRSPPPRLRTSRARATGPRSAWSSPASWRARTPRSTPQGRRAACPSGGCRAPSWARRPRCPTGRAMARRSTPGRGTRWCGRSRQAGGRARRMLARA